MVAALGVNQAWLFTSVFALGAFLAGLGGALQLPREPASLEMDLLIIASVFVVVVVGGMGSMGGAFAAALLISEIKAVCIWLGLVQIFGVSISFSRLTLVVEFVVMAVVLVIRPWGLLGRPLAVARQRVRAISASTVRSTRQLIAAAAPATRAMPTDAAIKRASGGKPGEARNMPIIAVKTIRLLTRGLHSA